MLFDMPPMIDAPPAYVQEVRSKRRKRMMRKERKERQQRQRQQQQRQQRGYATGALFVGAIVLLHDENGHEYDCQITHQTPDGQWWCNPLF